MTIRNYFCQCQNIFNLIYFTQLTPLKYPDRISTPSPEPIKKRARYTSVRQSVPPPPTTRIHHQKHQNSYKHHHQKLHGHNSTSRSHGLQFVPKDTSLSTIAEESGSYHSGSIPHMERSISQVSTLYYQEQKLKFLV